MPHSTNKELILGIMVGTAGISLLVLWYHKIRKPRTAMNFPKFLSLGNTFSSVTLQDDMGNDQGIDMIFQRRQLQILEKLNELLTNMEELKEEIRFLKETIPKLEEYIQDELEGKRTVHKISPQHRARKRRLTTVQSTATSNSSEEAESEGGCCKENQGFQPKCTEDQVTSDPQNHGASSISQPNTALGLITSRPSAAYKFSSPKRSRQYSSSSSTSIYSLFTKFQKNNTFPGQRQSRANFDFQEDINFSDLKASSDHFGALRSRRRFSSRKLSVVSCYRSAIFNDLQSRGLNEIELFSKNPSNTDAQRSISFSESERGAKNLTKFEARATPAARRKTIDRASYQSSIASFFSLPTVHSSSQTNRLATDIQENGQLNKDSKESFHPRSHRDGINHSPSAIQQHSFQTVASTAHHDTGFSLFHKNASSFTPTQQEVTSGSFEAENFADSSQNEDKPSPSEITKISSPQTLPSLRYITANTDTEEQGFPVAKAFNIHVEELKLDVLLQKADHLRMNESGKMESFELLCDHKEKFRDEIEFMWRFARAYGDMCELSTNTQEKKHYANIGKTLGEKAITRAPLNGHCHLWYAVLCGFVSEFEGLQNKINYGHCFQEHLDIAIQLLPEEPFLYYLKGRYCYTISKLSWIEKKMAATLFGKIPSSTVQEALRNFLKAEELQPGYSMSNYMYVAKCYVDLGEDQEAWKFCNLALLLPITTKDDKDAHKELKKMITSLKR